MAGQKQVYSYEFMKQLIFVYYLLIIIFICITTVNQLFVPPCTENQFKEYILWYMSYISMQKK